jgi:hypothetical protein
MGDRGWAKLDDSTASVGLLTVNGKDFIDARVPRDLANRPGRRITT